MVKKFAAYVSHFLSLLEFPSFASARDRRKSSLVRFWAFDI